MELYLHSPIRLHGVVLSLKKSTGTFTILILSSHLCLDLVCGSSLLVFQPKYFVFLISPIRVTCPAHPMLFDLIVLIKFGETYKLCSSSFCSLLQSHTTSTPLGPNILLSTLFSNTVKLLFP